MALIMPAVLIVEANILECKKKHLVNKSMFLSYIFIEIVCW